MDERNHRIPMSRRRFTAIAASSALLPLTSPLRAGAAGGAAVTGRAEPEPSAGGAAVTGRAKPEPSARGPQQEEAPAGTDELLEYVRALYGERLDDDDLAVVREEIASFLRAGEALRQFPLENADPPAFHFQAWRGQEAQDR